MQPIATPTTLNTDDLKALVYGACFLASGGGGPISMALDFLQRMSGTVSLLPVTQLERDKTALMVVDLGSPDAAAEGHGFTAPVNAFKSLSAYLAEKEHKTIEYLLPGEIGAVNTLIPFYIASMMDGKVAVIDADPSGRADPRLTETLLAATNAPSCPAMIASDTQSSAGVKCNWTAEPFASTLFLELTAAELEEKARETVSQPEYHQVGGMACYPLDTNFLQSPAAKGSLVYNSVGRALTVGRQILSSPSVPALSRLLDLLHIHNYIFTEGKISKIINRTHGGFDVGKIIFSAPTGDYWVYYKNESLLAWDVKQGRPHAIAPDCINIMLASADGETPAGSPLSTADIREGQNCTLWGTACPEAIRITPVISQFMDDLNDILSAFPEDHVAVSAYIPIEDLNLTLCAKGTAEK